MNVIKETEALSRPITQYDDRISEQSENDIMDFETIDERALPKLTENCEDTVSSQPTTKLKSEEPDININEGKSI